MAGALIRVLHDSQYTLFGSQGSNQVIPVGLPILTTAWTSGVLIVEVVDTGPVQWPGDARLVVMVLPTSYAPDSGWLRGSVNEPLGLLRVGAPGRLRNVVFAANLGELRGFSQYAQVVIAWDQGTTAPSSAFDITIRLEVVGRDGNAGLVPHRIGGRQVHLRADAGISRPTASSAVNQWWDQSGNGRHAANPNATTTQMPTFVDGVLNGQPALSFDGGDLLATPAFKLSTFSIYAVFAQTTGTAVGMVYEHGASSPTTDGSYLFLNQTPTIEVSRSSVETAKGLSSATWASDSIFRIVRHDFDGTSAGHTITINGVQQATPLNNPTGNPGTALSTAQSLNIGSRSTLVFSMTGYIAELLVFSPQLSPDVALRLEREYFARRYNITVA